MKLMDLVNILNTDSIEVYDTEGNEQLIAECPYIEMACLEYRNREVKQITPLDNKMEIIIE